MADVRLQALPFDEAIAALKTRRDNPLPSGRWQEVSGEEHAIAGTVARSAGFDILGNVFSSLQENLESGQTFAAWKKDITPVLQQKGWWGKQVVDGEVVQLGSPHRLRTIYDVNMRVSHMTGRWEQIQRLKARRPWLRYSAVLDERTRQSHRGWHGTVLPVDHPWWDTHYPPNGWRCRCSVQQLSDRDLDRYGFEVSNDPEPKMRAWRNPVTGDVVNVPEGIDPGWGHHVGKAREVGLTALEKLASQPPELAALAPLAMPDLVDQARREFGAWLDGIDRARPRGESKAVGVLTSTTLAALRAAGRSPSSAVVKVRDTDIAHMLRDAKGAKGLPAVDLKRLPDVMAAPEAVLLDRQTDALVYVFSPSGGKAGKFIVRIDYVERVRGPDGKKQKTRVNVVRTAGLEGRQSLRDGKRYELIEGDWP